MSARYNSRGNSTANRGHRGSGRGGTAPRNKHTTRSQTRRSDGSSGNGSCGDGVVQARTATSHNAAPPIVVEASDDALAIAMALSDRRDEEERTLDSNLEPFGFTRKHMIKDGDCLFRCFSDFLYGTSSRHMEVRSLVVDHLESHRDFFEEFLRYSDAYSSSGIVYADDNDVVSAATQQANEGTGDPIARALQRQQQQSKRRQQRKKNKKNASKGEPCQGSMKDSAFMQYCKKMRQRNHWGGQFELQAFSQRFKVKIMVMSSQGIVAEHGTEESYDTDMLLCYSHGNHYDIAYPQSYFTAASVAQDIIYDILRDQIDPQKGPSYAELAKDAMTADSRGASERSRPSFLITRERGKYRNVEYENWLEELNQQASLDTEIARQIEIGGRSNKKKKTKKKNKKIPMKDDFPEVAPSVSVLPGDTDEVTEQPPNVWTLGSRNWSEVLKPEANVEDNQTSQQQLDSPVAEKESDGKVTDVEESTLTPVETPTTPPESTPVMQWAQIVKTAPPTPKLENEQMNTEQEEMEHKDKGQPPSPEQSFPSLSDSRKHSKLKKNKGKRKQKTKDSTMNQQLQQQQLKEAVVEGQQRHADADTVHVAEVPPAHSTGNSESHHPSVDQQAQHPHFDQQSQYSRNHPIYPQQQFGHNGNFEPIQYNHPALMNPVSPPQYYQYQQYYHQQQYYPYPPQYYPYQQHNQHFQHSPQDPAGR